MRNTKRGIALLPSLVAQPRREKWRRLGRALPPPKPSNREIIEPALEMRCELMAMQKWDSVRNDLNTGSFEMGCRGMTLLDAGARTSCDPTGGTCRIGSGGTRGRDHEEDTISIDSQQIHSLPII